MNKLRIAAVPDDRPVKLTVELPAVVFRDVNLYGEAVAKSGGQQAAPPEPAKLVALMVAAFMDSDRGFQKRKRETAAGRQGTARSG